MWDSVLAFEAFARTPADLCLIEVGLGGRFDGTNVFDHPAVSVIAPVDYDHLEMLGPELSKIAWEKAGIIKRGRPVVAARQPDEALEVIEREADDRMAPLFLMGRDFDAWEERGRLMVQMPDRLLDLPAPSLFGGYQFDNAGLAVAAALTFDHSLGEDVLEVGAGLGLDAAKTVHEIWADDLCALAKQLDLPPFVVGGSSSGCRLATILALRHRAAIQALLMMRVTGGAFAVKRLSNIYYTQYIEAAQRGIQRPGTRLVNAKRRGDELLLQVIAGRRGAVDHAEQYLLELGQLPNGHDLQA